MTKRSRRTHFPAFKAKWLWPRSRAKIVLQRQFADLRGEPFQLDGGLPRLRLLLPETPPRLPATGSATWLLLFTPLLRSPHRKRRLREQGRY